MKLTKKLEAEIRKVYEAFWESLLNVNMRKFNSFLSEDFKQIGTTDAEVFFSKKEAAKFLKATEEQVVGNIQLRNRDIKIEPFDRSMLITEQSDAYVKIDNEWNFYAKCRATSLLQEIDGRWKFIQQHISFPDNRTK
ncbi:MAG TPA: nuclear transport factor 2 family protein, partial [Chitinophagaceae bacterium]|nr:nuclear transport factor 2 family protein [Chitinophagaceae bacterium]